MPTLMRILKRMAIAFVGTFFVAIVVGGIIGKLYISPRQSGTFAEIFPYLAIDLAIVVALVYGVSRWRR